MSAPPPQRWRAAWSGRAGGLTLALGVAVIVAACTSGSETTTGPTQAKCQVALSTLSASVGADGGSNSVTVNAAPECAWDVSTALAWVSDLAPRTGQGSGTLQFRVAPNPQPAARDGDIVVNDNRLHVSQAAGNGCQYALQPASLGLDADGGTRDVTVSSGGACTWTMSSDAPWISFTTSASGTGNGRVGVRVAANAGDRRVGTLTLADQRLTVTQSAPGQSCSYQVTLNDATIPAAGSTATAVVATAGECAWTASSGVGWITVASGGTSRGNGTAVFNVATNAGGARTGGITVAGQTFVLNQAGAATPCAFAIAPSSTSTASSGGTASTTVTTAASCPWTAASNDPWITVTSGASGTGSGPVAFSFAPNIGSARTGTVTVAGQTYTVSQAAAPTPCVYSLTATSSTIAAAGGTGSISVSTTAGCPWTAASNDAWIAVTGGASGTGSGPVAFSVAANAGAARTGTLSIAGQTFTVSQAAAPTPCVYALTATSTNIAAAGGTGSVGVTTTAGCAWTATSAATWITITSGATGSGAGTVAFTVATNTGGARTGTLTVAGQTFTVTQAAAAPCNYFLAPTSSTVDSAGGPGSFTVSTTAGCAWTATSNVGWVSVTSGATGSGGGTVEFNVAVNSGGDRIGTVTVAGQTFTITQAAPCAYAINPSSTNVAAAGATGTVGVTTTAACGWTATSNAVWITVTSGASGTGSGTVGYRVALNLGAARNGTVTIAGRTFTVQQSAVLVGGVAAAGSPRH